MNSNAREVVEEILRLRALVAAAMVGRLPEASPNFDRTRMDASIFEEVIRLRKVILQQLIPRAGAKPVATTAGAGEQSRNHDRNGKRARSRADSRGGDAEATPPPATPEERALRVLESLQLFVVQHPVAAQQVFSSLVVEGRRYAATEEGERWVRALAGSPLVNRARQLWESSLASVLEDDRETVLPSEYVEILLQGARLLAAPEELGARLSDSLTRTG